MQQLEDPFKGFISTMLTASMRADFVQKLIEPESLDIFRQAFTHETFFNQAVDKKGKLTYEAHARIGSPAITAIFNLWTYEITGGVVDNGQYFDDLLHYFTSTKYLANLSTGLNFDQYIQVADKQASITVNLKADIFRAFIGALIVAADRFVLQDIGFCLAKRWIYQLYNEWVRNEINPSNPSKYINDEAKVATVWKFMKWGIPLYVVTKAVQAPGQTVIAGTAGANLIAPSLVSVPDRYRDRIVGSGRGNTEEEARSIAAKSALENLQIFFPELIPLDAVSIKHVLSRIPGLLGGVERVLAASNGRMTEISVRKLRVLGRFVAQVKVLTGGIWRNGARAESDLNEDDAIEKAIKSFIDKDRPITRL